LIAAIGDSFTYGWGVAEAEAWPRVMERQLGGLARVANLGVAGGLPRTYAEVAERAVPRLRPDLIIVAVLQGDDLAQPAQEPPFLDRRGALRKWVAGGFRRIAPNMVQIRRNRNAPEKRSTSPDQLRKQWREDVRRVLNGLPREGRQQFESLEADVRNRYEGGDLNPWLLWCSTRVPDYYLLTLDLGASRVSRLIEEMTADLKRIADVCRKNGVPIVAVSVPHGMYNNLAAHRGTQRVGFLVSPAMLESTGPDVAISRSARLANLPFLSVSDVFRAHQGDPGLYFELDGHFTAEGHRLFAEALAPLVKGLMAGARRGATLPTRDATPP
jgi:lysophospholipase L1-like esterase